MQFYLKDVLSSPMGFLSHLYRNCVQKACIVQRPMLPGISSYRFLTQELPFSVPGAQIVSYLGHRLWIGAPETESTQVTNTSWTIPGEIHLKGVSIVDMH